MPGSSSAPLIVESRPKGVYAASTCPYCKTEIEYIKPKSTQTTSSASPSASSSTTAPFQIKCCHCSNTYNGPIPKEAPKKGARGNGGRSIGTGEFLFCSVKLFGGTGACCV